MQTVPGKAVIVKNVRPSFTCDMLEALFEDNKITGGGPIEKVQKHGETCAVITFEEHTVAAKVVSKREINHKKEQFLIDWFNGESPEEIRNKVYVTNINEASDGLLEILFENRAKTGGGPIRFIERKGTDSAVITFESPEDAKRVVGRKEIRHKKLTFDAIWFDENMMEKIIVSPLKSKKLLTTQAIPPAVQPMAGSDVTAATKDDIKKKSSLFLQQSPNVYSVPLVKQSTKGNLKWFELGSRSVIPQTKTIMVVGATGSGKTTLINGMINYILGVEWDDPYRFVLVNEPASANQAESQTQDITVYTVNHREGFRIPYNLTIIDTPGFGDTRGIVRDQEITKLIKEYFTASAGYGISSLTCICFVAQSSLPRLTITQQYIFDQILQLFGKDIGKNINLMLTFADAAEAPVLSGINEAKIPYRDGFKFNNSALFRENKSGSKKGNAAKFDEMFWQMGIESFESFFETLGQMEDVSLYLTREVLEEREKIQCKVIGIRTEIDIGLNTLETLKQEMRVVEQHQTEINANQNFTYTTTEFSSRQEAIPHGQHITNCLQCNHTCHEVCIIADDAKKRGCAAIDRTTGNCVICPDKCYWTHHKNMRYKIIGEIKTVEKTYDDLKRRYDEAGKNELSAKQVVEKLTDDFIDRRIKVMKMIDHVRKSLVRLSEIALRPNPLSTGDYIDKMIASEESSHKPGWKDRIIQLKQVKGDFECIRKCVQQGIDPFESYIKKLGIETNRPVKSIIESAKTWIKSLYQQFSS